MGNKELRTEIQKENFNKELSDKWNSWIKTVDAKEADHFGNWCYDKGYQKAISDMLDISYEWRDNHGSFLDFQRVLRNKLN